MSDWWTALGCSFLEVDVPARRIVRDVGAGRSFGLLMNQRFGS